MRNVFVLHISKQTELITEREITIAPLFVKSIYDVFERTVQQHM